MRKVVSIILFIAFNALVAGFVLAQDGGESTGGDSGEGSSGAASCSVPPSCACSGASCSSGGGGGKYFAKCKDEKGEVIKYCVGFTVGVQMCACDDSKEEALEELSEELDFGQEDTGTGDGSERGSPFLP